MDDLIARVLSGEAEEPERQALERWRRAAPGHERTYQECVRAWELAALADPPAPVPPPPSAADVAARAERRRQRATPLVPPRAAPQWRWAAAAALVAAAAGGVLLLRPAAGRIVVAEPDAARTVQLQDGSVVRLAPGGRLAITDSVERTIQLDGTAFFAVVADSLHPFVVRARAGRAEALGTRFEVRAAADSLRLVVLEGRVRLSSDGQAVIAHAGQMSRIDEGPPTLPRAVDALALLDWPEGLLIFQATPLADALREVGAWFGLPVVIRDSTRLTTAVTAWFEHEPLADVVATICQVVGARCAVTDAIEVLP